MKTERWGEKYFGYHKSYVKYSAFPPFFIFSIGYFKSYVKYSTFLPFFIFPKVLQYSAWDSSLEGRFWYRIRDQRQKDSGYHISHVSQTQLFCVWRCYRFWLKIYFITAFHFVFFLFKSILHGLLTSVIITTKNNFHRWLIKGSYIVPMFSHPIKWKLG